jgi:hypothetical protein
MIEPLLDLQQLIIDFSGDQSSLGRTLWGGSGGGGLGTAPEPKSKPNLSSRRISRRVYRSLWRVALVTSWVKIVEQISTYSSKADTEWPKLIDPSAWLCICTLLAWLDATILTSTCVVATNSSSSTSSRGRYNRTSACRAVLLPLKPASEARKMQDMATWELLWT